MVQITKIQVMKLVVLFLCITIIQSDKIQSNLSEMIEF